MEGEVFTSFTAAGQQGAVQMWVSAGFIYSRCWQIPDHWSISRFIDRSPVASVGVKTTRGQLWLPRCISPSDSHADFCGNPLKAAAFWSVPEAHGYRSIQSRNVRDDSSLQHVSVTHWLLLRRTLLWEGQHFLRERHLPLLLICNRNFSWRRTRAEQGEWEWMK